MDCQDLDFGYTIKENGDINIYGTLNMEELPKYYSLLRENNHTVMI